MRQLWYRVGCSDRYRARSMDKSVHPPANRAEAAHSCAAWVAAIATAPGLWTRVSILLLIERRRHTLVPRVLQRSRPCPVNGQECPSSCKSNGGGTLLCRLGCSDRDRARSMDKSVHPPVNRTEAVHSCAAWVAVIATAPDLWTRVSILLRVERRRHTLLPQCPPKSPTTRAGCPPLARRGRIDTPWPRQLRSESSAPNRLP